MEDVLAAVKEELRGILRELEAQRGKLETLAGRVPAGPADANPQADLEETDEAGELRTTIQCVLADSLRPLIEDLRAVAGPSPE
jgi:hypothetical protein